MELDLNTVVEINDKSIFRVDIPGSVVVILLLMVSSSFYVSHMFVTRVLSSLVFRVVRL